MFSSDLLGIHHVTAISRSPQATVDFYTQILGLKLVKLTVNYDDPSTYHLYFGNDTGQPGTILTFFPWPEAPNGVHGSGQLTTVSFSIPVQSEKYWKNRLDSHGIRIREVSERFGESVIDFNDPDGQNLELVVSENSSGSGLWKDGPVPLDKEIRGFHSVTLHEQVLEDTESLLVDLLGFEEKGMEKNRYRYGLGNDGGLGNIVDVLALPHDHRGLVSVGTVHHVAFRVLDDKTQLTVRERLQNVGANVTPVINRTYFHSIYFREPGGVLFEVATDPPGFTVDEPIDKLGTSLTLPSWLEHDREQIVASLPKIQLPQLVI